MLILVLGYVDFYIGMLERGSRGEQVPLLPFIWETKVLFIKCNRISLDIDMMQRRSTKLYRQAKCDWKRD